MRNVDAERLAAGYRKGHIPLRGSKLRAASRKSWTQRKKENLVQLHEELVLA
ncbi:hypothetical protein [Nostoc sp.]|uniref:hypothetical protein n=1 Tax=Nostoc sp. TaxID=1180 RepID=UPI002FF14B5A